MKINYLIESVKKLQVNKPTFVASEKKVLKKCQKLSKIFDSNYAYIEKCEDKHGSSIALCGRVNPDAILITSGPKRAAFYLEDMELIWCAGANNIYAQKNSDITGENGFSKLSNPFTQHRMRYI